MRADDHNYRVRVDDENNYRMRALVTLITG
jgi:hypothetical protein